MKWLVLVAAVMACYPRPASAAGPRQLFSFRGFIVGSQGGTPPTSFTFPVLSSIPSLGYYGPAVFLNQQWTVADVGKTVTEPASADPDLGIALTDGVLENLSFAMNGTGDSYSVPEPYAIFGDQHDPRIDLYGDTITSYSLTLDSLSRTNNSYQYQTTFAAYGFGPVQGVPEPATLALLTACGFAIARRRRSQYAPCGELSVRTRRGLSHR